jgi:hypothetical protein
MFYCELAALYAKVLYKFQTGVEALKRTHRDFLDSELVSVFGSYMQHSSAGEYSANDSCTSRTVSKLMS